MRVCDLNTGLGRLSMAFSDLKERWAEVKDAWHDQTCEKFQKTHLGPLSPQLQHLISAVSQLAQAVDAAQNECDDRPE